MNKHVQKIELPDGTLMCIEGGNSEDTAQRIIKELGGTVKPTTHQQQQPPAKGPVLVFSNEPSAGAPQPPPGVVTPLEIPSTADPDWPNRYQPPVPYVAQVGTYHRTPLFTENAPVTPLEAPEPTFIPQNKTQQEIPQNYRPAGTDGLVNNGITPLLVPTMKF